MAMGPLVACLVLASAASVLGARGVGDHAEANFRRTSLRKPLQEPDPVPRIANGRGAYCGRFPYMVSLNDRQNVHKCGGVLVHPKWVLTAAHCVDPQSPKSLGATPIIVIGACSLHEEENSNGHVEFVQPKRAVIHERWTGDVIDGYDIALLKLQRSSRHTPVGLPPDVHEIPDNEPLLALGWGLDEGGDRPQDLRQAGVDLVRHSICNAEGVWNGSALDSMVCAFGLRGQDVCQGDSGGPLLQPFAPNGNLSQGQPELDVVVGITSFGDTEMCGSSQRPSIYTKTGSFIDWIQATVKTPSQSSASPLTPANHSTPQSSSNGIQPTAPPPSLQVLSEESQPVAPEATAAPVSKKQKRRATKELKAAFAVVEAGGDTSSVQSALTKGADVNAWLNGEFSTPLMLAAELGHLELVELLLQAGARVDARDVYGQTALIYAAAEGHVDIVVALIDAKADVNAAADDGITPLLVALQRLLAPVVEGLLAAKADPNKADISGFAPLHEVSFSEGPDSSYLAGILIDAGADVDTRTSNGRTPLYQAAFRGNLDVVRTLMRRGADPSIADNKDREPFAVVCKCRQSGKCQGEACSYQGDVKKIRQLLTRDR